MNEESVNFVKPKKFLARRQVKTFFLGVINIDGPWQMQLFTRVRNTGNVCVTATYRNCFRHETKGQNLSVKYRWLNP